MKVYIGIDVGCIECDAESVLITISKSQEELDRRIEEYLKDKSLLSVGFIGAKSYPSYFGPGEHHIRKFEVEIEI